VFYANPFLVVAPFLVVFFLYNAVDKPNFRQNVMKVDWAGMLLITLACVPILYAVLTGGSVNPWTSAPVLAPLLSGLAVLGLFVLQQWILVRKFKNVAPLIPTRIFSNHTAQLGYAITIIHAIVLQVIGNFLFIYFHVSTDLSILLTAVITLPSSGVLLVAAAGTGYVTSRIQHYKVFIWVGGVLMVAGFGSFIPFREDSSRVTEVLLQFIGAVGSGMVFPARTLATQAPQRPEDFGTATALVSFVGVRHHHYRLLKVMSLLTRMQNLGMSFAVPIGNIIFQSTWKTLLDHNVKQGHIPTNLIIPASHAEGTAEIVKGFPPSAKAVAKLYQHIAALALSNVWILATSLSAAVLLLGLIMKEVPLVKASNSDSHEEKKKQEIPRVGIDRAETIHLMAPEATHERTGSFEGSMMRLWENENGQGHGRRLSIQTSVSDASRRSSFTELAGEGDVGRLSLRSTV
jgi:hypothetical protein